MLLILHILGFFAIIIPLLTLGPRGDTKEVFTTFINTGGWSSQGLSFCIGLMGNVFAFVGEFFVSGHLEQILTFIPRRRWSYSRSVTWVLQIVHLANNSQMSEEIHNAAVVVPRSIMTGIMINGSLGFAMILAILYRAGDINQASQENPLYPFMAILKHAMSSTAGAAIMASIVMILATSSTVGILASSSRVFWAFSRDRGLPGWRILSKVNSSIHLREELN